MAKYPFLSDEWMTEAIAEGVRLWKGEYDPLRGISVMTLDPADPIR